MLRFANFGACSFRSPSPSRLSSWLTCVARTGVGSVLDVVVVDGIEVEVIDGIPFLSLLIV